MAVTATASLVGVPALDPGRPPNHAGWNNPGGDPEWFPDVDVYRRVQLACTGSAGEVGSIVNWELYDDKFSFKTTAQINALADGTTGVFINNTTTRTVWAYTGTNVAGSAYADTKAKWIATLRANGPRVQVLLGPKRKIGDPSVNWRVEAFLPGSFGVPSGTANIDIIPPAAVTGVTVAPPTASVAVGATTQLTETVAPVGAINKAVTWKSSDVTKAVVVGDGQVLGVAIGSAVITATTEMGGFTATSTITVTAPVLTGITISPVNPTLASPTGTQLLTASPVPAGASLGTVNWTSGTTAAATVSPASGTTTTVTGVAGGTSVITATSGAANGTTTVTVPAAVLFDAPSTSWSKNDITTWLLDNGVALDRKALGQLTKAELLDLVDDILDGDTDTDTV
jgi:uncharacterized protein YjdB